MGHMFRSIFCNTRCSKLYNSLFDEEERKTSVYIRRQLRSRQQSQKATEQSIKYDADPNIDTIDLVNNIYTDLLKKYASNKEKIHIEMEQWFLTHKINFRTFASLKTTPYFYTICILDYQQMCDEWSNWTRQCRGLVIMNLDNVWIPIRYTLQRGAELLTGLHISANINETDNIKDKSLKNLSISQQTITKTLIKGGILNGFLSSKKDGSLMTVTVYTDPRVAKIMNAVILTTGDDFAKLVLKMGLSICNKVITISSLGTLSAFHMQSYFVQSILSQYISDDELYELAKSTSYLEALKLYGTLFFEKISTMISQQESLFDISSLTFNFETIVKDRMTAWSYKRLNAEGYSHFHYELAMSYKKSDISFLGIGISKMDGHIKSLPHFVCNFNQLFNVPIVWKITSSNDVNNILTSLSDVLCEKISESDFFHIHKSKQYTNTNTVNYELDFEGFVLYTNPDLGYTKATQIVGQEYNKIKLVEYYVCHILKKKNIKSIIDMSQFTKSIDTFPTVKFVSESIKVVAICAKYLIDNIYEIISSNDFFMSLSEETQDNINKNLHAKYKIIIQTHEFKKIGFEYFRKHCIVLGIAISEADTINQFLQYIIGKFCHEQHQEITIDMIASDIRHNKHKHIVDIVWIFSDFQLNKAKEIL